MSNSFFINKPASNTLYPMQLEEFVEEIDFMPSVERIDDQYRQGSCVAQTLQKFIEVSYMRAGISINLAAQYLYYPIRKLSNTLESIRGGGYAAVCGQVMEEWGCCLEETWPYDQAMDGVEPSLAAQEQARSMFPPGSTEFKRVDGLLDIKRKLHLGMPVMITLFVHPEMLTLGNNWRTHTWDITVPYIGLHEVLIIGCGSNRLLCVNSWDGDWGDGGFFGIPYEYLTSGKLLVDNWTFPKLPIPYIKVPGYVPEDLPTFTTETGILTLPTIHYFQGNFGGSILFNRGVLKITKFGTLTVDDDRVYGDDSYFESKTWNSPIPRLSLPRVLVDGKEYRQVKLVGLEFEIIAGEVA